MLFVLPSLFIYLFIFFLFLSHRLRHVCVSLSWARCICDRCCVWEGSAAVIADGNFKSKSSFLALLLIASPTFFFFCEVFRSQFWWLCFRCGNSLQNARTIRWGLFQQHSHLACACITVVRQLLQWHREMSIAHRGDSGMDKHLSVFNQRGGRQFGKLIGCLFVCVCVCVCVCISHIFINTHKIWKGLSVVDSSGQHRSPVVPVTVSAMTVSQGANIPVAWNSLVFQLQDVATADECNSLNLSSFRFVKLEYHTCVCLNVFVYERSFLNTLLILLQSGNRQFFVATDFGYVFFVVTAVVVHIQ